eukprot:4651329-Ditylum_brightwellii.AAC.1
MVPKDYWDKELVGTALKSVFWDKNVKLRAEEQFLVEAIYKKIDIDDVVNNQQHLTEDERTLLQTLLKSLKTYSKERLGLAG